MTLPNTDPPRARRQSGASAAQSPADLARRRSHKAGARQPGAPGSPRSHAEDDAGSAADAAAVSDLSSLHLLPDSLAFALDGAAQIVGAVRAGAALPAALAALGARVTLPAARGAIQDSSYRAMRALGTADALVALLVRKAPPPHVANLLCCAFALLIDASDATSATIDSARTSRAPYPPFTVVDQAVGAIAARREYAFAKGLVNAVLRSFLRSPEALLAQVRQDAQARWNYPAWWIAAVEHAWPDDWQAILAAGNRQAPLTLRVNRRRASVGEYLETLRAAGLDAAQIGPSAVRLAQAVPVERLPGFAAGVVSVQDAGAQCAAPLLEVADGMRVLDACAAPGGKTGHLLELADLELVALESDPVRAARIAGNLERLGLAASARIVIGDAGTPSVWHDGLPFDRILADLPCTASGIVRRHPDIRWLRRASDIAALAAQQRRLASALWPLVAPGGQLLLVTCSIFPEEGETQAQWFGSAHADAVRLDSPGQMLPACADAVAGTDHDGFFYARFQKR